jgi:hypothetical protein
MLIKWRFRGTSLLNKVPRRFVRVTVGFFVGLFTRGAVPGWYDTHARHSCAKISNVMLLREGS